MILNRDKAICVMVDMQERLIPAISRHEEMTGSCKLLMEGLQLLNVPIIATQQYTKGLGETVQELKELTTDSPYIEKITFSCFGEPDFRKALKESKATQVIVCGIETHICVEQTVLDLIEAGLEVFVMADCTSSRFESDRETALRRMEKAGAVITTSEAALFELTKQGGTDTFRAISKLVKTRSF